MATLGELIKVARKSKGLTQKELAEIVGVNQSMVAQWENDYTKPRPNTVGKLARALDVHDSDIVGVGQSVHAEQSVIEMLRSIYGYCEYKEVSVFTTDNNEPVTRSSGYYQIGIGSKTFALYDADMEMLHSIIKESIKPIVERIKDTRSTTEIEQEILRELED